ncbi:MAG TPA: hypothetical protein PLZ51_06190 [Aggregatilineales bacterium]|nr:hypothetical protein [Aggregatilineales bacterium]
MGRKIVVDADVIAQLITYYSFEMRARLTTIIGYAKTYQHFPEQWKMDYLDIILKNGELCFEFLEMLRNSINLETDNFRVYASEFDIKNLLQDVVEHRKAEASYKNITLQFDILPDAPNIIFHHYSAIRTIFADLLINCINSSGENTTILLVCGHVDDKKWYLRLICDVAHDDANLLLYPQQFHIIQKFVALIGGEIDVIKNADNYAQCTVTLPIRYEAQSESHML